MDTFLHELERHYIKMGTRLTLPDLERLPVGRQAAAESLPYENSLISLRIAEQQISCHGEPTLSMSTVEETADGLRVQVVLAPQSFDFTCVVTSREDIETDMDSGGGLDVAATWESEDEKEKWLNQARENRTRLVGSPNGQQLLLTYGEHNDVFEELFRKSSAMRAVWQQGGITKEMSRDTSDALNSGKKINDKKYTMPNTNEALTYNQCAFLRKQAVIANTILLDPRYDPFDPHAEPPTDGAYYEAAVAADQFKSAVALTGNTEKVSSPLNGEQVYGAVENTTLPTEASRGGHIDNLKQMMGMAFRLSDRDASLSAPADAADDVYARAESAILRDAVLGAQRDRQKEKNLVDVPILHIPGRAIVEDVRVTAWVTAKDVTIESIQLPDFDIDIDDTQAVVAEGIDTTERLGFAEGAMERLGVVGEAGALALARFQEMNFMRKLMYDNLVQAIGDSLTEAMRCAYEATHC